MYVEIKKLDGMNTVVITVNREKALNALNQNVLKDLDRAFDEAAKIQNLRCVILTGAGQKAFVAGADIDFMKDMTQEQARDFSCYGSKIFRKIEIFPAPVIGAVNGYALGGGMELALACDFRLASENAVFGLPEPGLGIIPGWGGMQRLIRSIPVGKAKEMVYSSERIDAAKALGLGLVNAVVPAEQLLDSAAAIARRIEKNAPQAIENAKKAMNEGNDMDIQSSLDMETALFPDTFGSAEQVGRMEAFMNKSKK